MELPPGRPSRKRRVEREEQASCPRPGCQPRSSSGLCGLASARASPSRAASTLAPPVPKTKIAVVQHHACGQRTMINGRLSRKSTSKATRATTPIRAIQEQGAGAEGARWKTGARGSQGGPNTPFEAKNVDRKAQDLGEEASEFSARKNDEMTVQIYREIGLRSSFRGGPTRSTWSCIITTASRRRTSDNPQNVQRKLQAGPLIPIYAADGLEITDTIIFMLNDTYKRSSQIQPTGGR